LSFDVALFSLVSGCFFFLGCLFCLLFLFILYFLAFRFSHPQESGHLFGFIDMMDIVRYISQHFDIEKIQREEMKWFDVVFEQKEWQDKTVAQIMQESMLAFSFSVFFVKVKIMLSPRERKRKKEGWQSYP
jgi:hypothetical protein